jgi:hypothetical protein
MCVLSLTSTCLLIGEELRKWRISAIKETTLESKILSKGKIPRPPKKIVLTTTNTSLGVGCTFLSNFIAPDSLFFSLIPSIYICSNDELLAKQIYLECVCVYIYICWYIYIISRDDIYQGDSVEKVYMDIHYCVNVESISQRVALSCYGLGFTFRFTISLLKIMFTYIYIR